MKWDAEAQSNSYLRHLAANADHYQQVIGRMLDQYQVQPVGNGYIDLILPVDRALRFIAELSRNDLCVESISWWCLCTDESRVRYGCPHGYGGPLNRDGAGWFSECTHFPDFEIREYGVRFDLDLDPRELAQCCAEVITHYLEQIFPTEEFYSPCLHPGLWLYVPSWWGRLR
jgi:hypothetical protein